MCTLRDQWWGRLDADDLCCSPCLTLPARPLLQLLNQLNEQISLS